MKFSLLLASVALVSASVAAAAPEPVMSQAEADAVANAIAQDASAPAEAAPAGGCAKPMRDGRCPPVANSRQFVFGATPAATKASAKGGYAAKSYARPMELAINFVVGSAQLTEASKRSLDRLAASFTRASNSMAQFFVDGHTDRSGTCEANLKLSQERAASAVAYLASAGVDPSRMTPRGFGFQELKVPGNPNSGANRRVEVVAKKPATDKPLPTC